MEINVDKEGLLYAIKTFVSDSVHTLVTNQSYLHYVTKSTFTPLPFHLQIAT